MLVLCLTSNHLVATMNAMMLIHTAPHPRKKISPRRFDAFELKYEEEGAAEEADAPELEAEGTVSPAVPLAACPLPFRCVISADMAAASCNRRGE